MAAMKGWKLHQMDVFNAFLQGDLLEELTEALLASGFHQSLHDYSLFTKTVGAHIVLILVYVDDLIITGSCSTLIEEAKSLLHHHFKIKDLGELRYFLGLEIARSDQGILICQRKFTLDLIADMGLAGSKPASTPLEPNQKLTSFEFDQGHEGDTNDELLADPRSYQKLVGKLLYLTMTRPDISFTIQNLSQFMHNPKKSHMEAALRVVRYLKNAPELGILLS
ncbi:uncharacterized mitochondrial protein AtMg00810-like [Solanum tuberosum]|uniref:uncharacterized mitochondrial protein AtMg00810-like n=1 Tax=Solanum tuberosum TaxID=4113 RepID=UPI00073A05FA|nr:PREDICTED: uncharacterized mitochondrial protein AtMg00810-like [Solanum tuberosum]